MKKEISNKPYTIDVSTWTCNCGHQKYHCHHLCKHLVQAVGLPDKRFFRTIVRRRVVPIYQHPLLVLRGSTPGEYVEPDGAITDGDDNIWSGNKKLLKGSDGRWKELVEVPKPAGSTAIVGGTVASRQSKKRRQENVETEEQNHKTDSPKRRRQADSEPEVIDLTMSSPVAIPIELDNLESIPERSPSSIGFDYGSADEHEVNLTL
jgi:hypothetical protein